MVVDCHEHCLPLPQLLQITNCITASPDAIHCKTVPNRGTNRSLVHPIILLQIQFCKRRGSSWVCSAMQKWKVKEVNEICSSIRTS
ncbi:hypothetical protein GDO81_029666 [Engystomops pustulosus]|uniref:Uncharacterized protein n=1 Tax=Engystomops pustulosus TaxID=76066 RepID=A0AAV6Z5G3_ENGPU|nr:hypothetical protein GDO81_029666 [Engystomops pustulosus]